MRNKNGVIFITIVISLLCLYYLSFTFIAMNVQSNAEEYATTPQGNINYDKEQAYLDSVWNEPVFNLFGIEYTYKDVKQTELNLGLDLKGGMHVILEVAPQNVIRGLSGNSEDDDFQAALKRAQEMQQNSQQDYVTLFVEAFQEVAPNKNLSSIFANAANRGDISYDSSDEEVAEFLNSEVESAIERSFHIIRTRLDQYGTSQPNIQRLPNSGRLQVELPGVDNPERVRDLLQSAAKLEFLEVYNFNEISGPLERINEMLAKRQTAQNLGSSDESQDTTSREEEEEDEDLSNLLGEESESATDTANQEDNLESQLEDQGETQDTASDLDSLQNQQVSPLFSLLQSNPNRGFIYRVQDTAKINDILEMEEVQQMLPNRLEWVWSAKPLSSEITNANANLIELYPLKTARGGEAPLTGEVITDASQDFDRSSQPAVMMNMNSVGARKWKRMTANNVGDRIAIVLDNRVYSAPNVEQEIPSGRSSITGNFSITEAKDLANILEAGALPAKVKIVEEAIIGPTLGKQAQQQGFTSIILGLVLVVVFVVIYYMKAGLVANLALLFNLFFIMGILAQPSLDASLTLPGIAGMVLIIGMSIDANVLIFERIREELRNGVKLKQSISAGYQKAYSSIIDSNATTLLVGIILFTMGQGPVQGFAVTLIIGIICSFFSAIFITRVVIEWMTKEGDQSKISFDTPFSRNLFKNLNIDFLSKRKVSYVFSTLFIIGGISIIVLKGGLNLGVDFKGGRSYVLTFEEPVSATEMKTALSENFGEAGIEAKTFGANNVIKVTTSYLVDDESSEADEEVRQKLISGVEQFTGTNYVQNDTRVDEDHFTISSSAKVGATIADDIKNASQRAIIFSLIVVFFYILVRFRKWQFGLGAITALFHDTLVVLAAFGFAQLFGYTFEIDQVFIAAMLTIIGYSINDTVIVFDRIRENINARPHAPYLTTFNTSINDVMSRTLITSGTTLVVILILLLFGGEVLRGFSFALLIGVLVGTYSSIFIATPVVADLSMEKPKKVEKEKQPEKATQKV